MKILFIIRGRLIAWVKLKVIEKQSIDGLQVERITILFNIDRIHCKNCIKQDILQQVKKFKLVEIWNHECLL